MTTMMERTLRLLSTAEGLGAMAALLEARAKGTPLAPALEERLSRVVKELGVPEARDAIEEKMAAGAVRAFLAQSLELIDTPQRPFGWEPADVVLEAQGRTSISVAREISRVSSELFDLHARLSRTGARFLDVGTGAGWLAIEFARSFPSLHVEGCDILERALTLARKNIASEKLEARVTVRSEDVTKLTSGGFDAIWLPGPFLPREVAVEAITRARKALVPRGVLLFGLFGDFGDGLSRTLAEVRALRAGGHPWTVDELRGAITSAGFSEVKVLELSVGPLRLFAAR